MAVKEKEKEKSESSKKEKDLSDQNPIDIASKAIQSDPVSALPPTISLSDGGIPKDPLQMKRAIQDEMISDAFEKLRWNMVDGALAQSKAYKAREEKELADATRNNLNPAASPSPVAVAGINPGGLLQPHNDRAAIIDAALKGLDSDEAKLKFLNEPPTWLSSPVNVSGGVPRQFPPSVAPVPSPVSSDPVSIIRDVSSMIVDQLKAGMDIQKAVNPQSSSNSGSGTPSVVEVIDKFKEINKTTTDAFTNLFKESQDQTKKLIDDLKEANTKLMEDKSKLQMDMIDKDREYMREHIKRLETALSQPRPQYREVIEEARSNGVKITTDTPEWERARAEIAREDRKLEHQLTQAEKKSDLELIREKRRFAMANVAGSMAGRLFDGLIGGQELKKHKMSPDATAVATRF